jgi:hypothetical protein
VPRDGLAQEKNCLRIYSNAAIKTFARDFEKVAAFSNTGASVIDKAIDPSPA